ncbi:unnamed protein product [Closterium sp. Naga37s-1]|nr:unnamed protein product [Closterium sp. Naga37s-1]
MIFPRRGTHSSTRPPFPRVGRQQEGEVRQLQREVQEARAARDATADELLRVSQRLLALEKVGLGLGVATRVWLSTLHQHRAHSMPLVSTLPHQERVAVLALEAELQQLRARHEVALVMVGERNERVDELEADLADVRALYKEQVALLAAQGCMAAAGTHRCCSDLHRCCSDLHRCCSDLHRCCSDLHRCCSDLHRCCSDLHRCCSDLHRCCSDLHRCCSDLHRCCSDLHRCCSDLHRCCSDLHRCCSDLHLLGASQAPCAQQTYQPSLVSKSPLVLCALCSIPPPSHSTHPTFYPPSL